MNPPTRRTPRSVAIAGATGLVGRCILQGLLDDPAVTRVHALVRRPMAQSHPKLQVQVVDFKAVPALPPVDEVYLALGTTIKIAGSQAAFRAVDFDANFAVARAAIAAGARRAGLVSAMGADAKSTIFYNRVKGELEDALAQEGLETLAIARPSMLLGDRAALGQPLRNLEQLTLRANGLLQVVLPRNLRPIAARDVAQALLKNVPSAQGRVFMLSGEMQPAR